MAGLVPAIHVCARREADSWMPGTRPGMTTQSFVAACAHPAFGMVGITVVTIDVSSAS
jgi:hypothetical protein